MASPTPPESPTLRVHPTHIEEQIDPIETMIKISSTKITKLLKKNFSTIQALRASLASKRQPEFISDIQRLKHFQDIVFQEIIYLVQVLLKQLELSDCMSLWNNTNSLILSLLTSYSEDTVRALAAAPNPKL